MATIIVCLDDNEAHSNANANETKLAKVQSCDLTSGLTQALSRPPSLVQPNDDGDFKGQSATVGLLLQGNYQTLVKDKMTSLPVVVMDNGTG
jgi:hypothetical protein